eukprot:3267685-Amphidinium_carterae.1
MPIESSVRVEKEAIKMGCITLHPGRSARVSLVWTQRQPNLTFYYQDGFEEALCTWKSELEAACTNFACRAAHPFCTCRSSWLLSGPC